MKVKSLLIFVTTMSLFWWGGVAFSLTGIAIPTEPIYFEPPVAEAPTDLRQLNCVALDNNIRYLHPYRYSYKPSFYQDEANKIATTLITIDSLPVVGTIPIVGEWIGFAYLGYSALMDEKEQRRTLQVEQQIAMLQQLKAEKHCFE